MTAETSPTGSRAVVWIERALGAGSRVVRLEPLPGSSTRSIRVEARLADGSMRRLLLRRYHDAERLARDPWYVPAQEARALALIAAAPFPAPRLLAADLEAEFCDVPALLLSWLPGEVSWRPTELDRYLARSAEKLVAIHSISIPPGAELRRYATYEDPASVASRPSSSRPGLWARVAAALTRPRPAHRDVFLHRDYHQGNVLVDGGEVSGIIDWATACCGPAGIDLARMRQNLAWHVGGDAPERFVAAYVAAGGDPAARHPYWDLLDAADMARDLEIGPDPALERYEDYVARMIAES